MNVCVMCRNGTNALAALLDAVRQSEDFSGKISLARCYVFWVENVSKTNQIGPKKGHLFFLTVFVGIGDCLWISLQNFLIILCIITVPIDRIHEVLHLCVDTKHTVVPNTFPANPILPPWHEIVPIPFHHSSRAPPRLIGREKDTKRESLVLTHPSITREGFIVEEFEMHRIPEQSSSLCCMYIPGSSGLPSPPRDVPASRNEFYILK